MSVVYRYAAQSGDALYALPDAGAFGFAFSRGTDPGGATLPVAVVQRIFSDGARVYVLRSAASVGAENATYACLAPIDAKHGQSLAGFLAMVQFAWNAQTGDTSAPPATLAAGARRWGWAAV